MLRKPLLLALLAIMALGPVRVALATDRADVNRAAKRAASHYVKRFGIYYTPSMWEVSCEFRHGPRMNGWHCDVRTNTRQCLGSLRLRPRTLRAYGVRIGCEE